MTATPATTPAKPRSRRGALIAGAVVLAMLLALIAGRSLIAQALATSWLQSYGVASRIEVKALSPGGLKARLRLGAEAAPDASVDELDAAYDLDGPWNGHGFGVVIRQVRLVRPHVALRWDGKRLTYGSLTRLVQAIAARPANPQVPTPGIVVEAGRLDVGTPYGVVGLAGDAALDDGALTHLQARLLPARLVMDGGVLATPGGPLSLSRQGRMLVLAAQAPLEATTRSGAQLGGGQIALSGTFPYPQGGGVAGPVQLAGSLAAAQLDLPGLGLTQPSAQIRFDGVSGSQGVTGRGRLDLKTARLQSGDLSAQAVATTLDLNTLTLSAGRAPLRFDGAGRFSLTAAQARARGYQAATLTADAQIAHIGWRTGPAGAWSVAGQGQAQLHAAAGAGLSIANVDLKLSGQATPAAFAASLAVSARGSADAATARRYAGLLAPADPAYATALQRAARDFSLQAPALTASGAPGAGRVSAAAPIRLASASGAVLTVSPAGGPLLISAASGSAAGGFEATLSGGSLPDLKVRVPAWRSAAGVTTASVTVSGTLTFGPAQGVTLQAAAGDLRVADGGVRLALAGCTPLTAQRVRFGETEAADLAARLCPAAANPLIDTRPGHWRTAGRVEAAQGAAPELRIRWSEAAGRFDLSGGGHDGAAGSFELETARLADTTADPRFNPVVAKGSAKIAGDRLNGRFIAALPASNRPLASVNVEHDLGRARGHAVIESHGLAFAKDGLQPGAISPLAAIARDAQGVVDFDGRFDWTAQGVTSSGRLRTDSLAFSSSLGQAKGAKTDIRFTSLAPPVTAPGQTLDIASIDGVVPMANLSAGFVLTADGAVLEAASADAARGRISLEPMRLDFAGVGTVRGALLLDHVDLGELLASSSLGDSMKVQMVVVGRLPFEARPPKFSFLQGHISAVQPGRISISRAALSGVNTGAPGSSTGVAVNAVQDLAYDALENLAFDTLEADVASRPGGRLGLIFRIKGRYDPPVKHGADFALPDLLNGSAFQKKIPLPSDTPINLNLDTSLNFDELMQALSDIWKRDAAHNSPAVQGGGR